jgi:hypothetical protein
MPLFVAIVVVDDVVVEDSKLAATVVVAQLELDTGAFPKLILCLANT